MDFLISSSLSQIKIKFYSFKCNIPYLNIFLNRILVDLDGDSGDFSGDSGGDSGDSGDSGESCHPYW